MTPVPTHSQQPLADSAKAIRERINATRDAMHAPDKPAKPTKPKFDPSSDAWQADVSAWYEREVAKRGKTPGLPKQPVTAKPASALLPEVNDRADTLLPRPAPATTKVRPMNTNPRPKELSAMRPYSPPPPPVHRESAYADPAADEEFAPAWDQLPRDEGDEPLGLQDHYGEELAPVEFWLDGDQVGVSTQVGHFVLQVRPELGIVGWTRAAAPKSPLTVSADAVRRVVTTQIRAELDKVAVKRRDTGLPMDNSLDADPTALVEEALTSVPGSSGLRASGAVRTPSLADQAGSLYASDLPREWGLVSAGAMRRAWGAGTSMGPKEGSIEQGDSYAWASLPKEARDELLELAKGIRKLLEDGSPTEQERRAPEMRRRVRAVVQDHVGEGGVKLMGQVAEAAGREADLGLTPSGRILHGARAGIRTAMTLHASAMTELAARDVALAQAYPRLVTASGRVAIRRGDRPGTGDEAA